MLKVNLEKEILRQNRSLVTSKELLLIREYDSLGEDVVNSDVLKRVFGQTQAEIGGQIRLTNETLYEETKRFDKTRVFHISQIEKLCKKYHLRFLPSILFKGSIDAQLPGKISCFEIAYEVECKPWVDRGYGTVRNVVGGKTYIAAPAPSFQLQEKPKDPLMFYEINKDWFYLIHKWGNDLSLFRRLLKFFSNWFVTLLGVAIPMIALGVFLILICPKDKKAQAPEVIGLFLLAGALAWIIVQLISRYDDLFTPYTFVKPNDWRSEHK